MKKKGMAGWRYGEGRRGEGHGVTAGECSGRDAGIRIRCVGEWVGQGTRKVHLCTWKERERQKWVRRYAECFSQSKNMPGD